MRSSKPGIRNDSSGRSLLCNEVSLEHSHAQSFTHVSGCFPVTAPQRSDRPYGSQSLICLLSGHLQEKETFIFGFKPIRLISSSLPADWLRDVQKHKQKLSTTHFPQTTAITWLVQRKLGLFRSSWEKKNLCFVVDCSI